MTDPSVSGAFSSDSDSAETSCKGCNCCDHEIQMDHTPQQNVGSRIMLLKLKKARLETQVAYTRTRLLLAEMELRMAEQELHHEVKKTTPEPKTPTRPQTKGPHKLVQLFMKVFKHSNNQNPEEPDTTTSTPEVKELAKKRKNLEATERSKKIKSKSDKAEDKENKKTFSINTQEVEQEKASISKKNSKDKSKKTSDIKKIVPETNEKGHSGGNKITKESKTEHVSRRHKHENSKEKDNKNSKGDKTLKSILKKSHITEVMGNNVSKNHLPSENIGIYEDSVEFNIRTIFHSPNRSNSCNDNNEIGTVSVDKAHAVVEAHESILLDKDSTVPILEGVVKVVSAMLEPSQNDQLFKELRGDSQKASSLGSMETLLLDEDSNDRRFEMVM